ncbi:unnamed protein product, partial [Mesorhabditis belari]|uniref:Uncharacterized protein n=1 Tax=Mesorhabditis belari TaxID=2138241 RepID=A0AAF3J1V7_9BILA
MLTAITVAVAAVFAQDSNSAVTQSPYNTLQCPCLRATNSNTCLPYDTRFQATTLDEAMLSFPDLSIDRNETTPEEPLHIVLANEKVHGVGTTYVSTELHMYSQITTVGCTTPECQKCQDDLRIKLEQIGIRPGVGLLTTPVDINSINNNNANNVTFCPRYRFTKKESGIRDYGELEGSNSSENSNSSPEEDSEEKRKKHSARRRRSTTGVSTMPSSSTLIGTRYPLSCTTKGVTVDSSGFVSLCSSCWVWRKLPDNYNPQYINELVCDDSDFSCLSGYAVCTTGHRTVEVVRTDAGAQTTVTLTAGTFCECKCSINSAIASLVTGGGVSSSLPALPANPTTAAAGKKRTKRRRNFALSSNIIATTIQKL